MFLVTQQWQNYIFFFNISILNFQSKLVFPVHLKFHRYNLAVLTVGNAQSKILLGIILSFLKNQTKTEIEGSLRTLHDILIAC